MYRVARGVVKKDVFKRLRTPGSENAKPQAAKVVQTVPMTIPCGGKLLEFACFCGAKIIREVLFRSQQVGREHRVMIREFAYFCRVAIPLIPPFVILVALFMCLSMVLYYMTKAKGFMIVSLSGFCYMVPWFLQCVLR